MRLVALQEGLAQGRRRSRERFFYSDQSIDDGAVKGPMTLEELQRLTLSKSLSSQCGICPEDSVNQEGEGAWVSFTAVQRKESAKTLPDLPQVPCEAVANTERPKKKGWDKEMAYVQRTEFWRKGKLAGTAVMFPVVVGIGIYGPGALWIAAKATMRQVSFDDDTLWKPKK